jgi:peptidoglycan/xylan/chitin deacetylase (PgdA/CDA1 family)
MTLSQLEVTGAEVYAVTIGDQLSRRGHVVTYASDTLSKTVLGNFIPIKFNKRSLVNRILQIIKLVWTLKKYNIQLVHTHSRAAGWSSYIACKLTRTPMVTTVHGRQPAHSSRKLLHAFGHTAIAVAEAIKEQIVQDLGVPERQVTVLRNAIDTNKFPLLPLQNPNSKPVVSIIGRLTGPKGELCIKLLECVFIELIEKGHINLRIVTSSEITQRFVKYGKYIRRLDPNQDILEEIKNSHLIIGAGRVAAEALLVGRPVFAIGEAKSLGLITLDNINEALKSNFGDIGPKELQINFDEVKDQLENFVEALNNGPNSILIKLRSEITTLHSKVDNEFNLITIVDKVEGIYQTAVVDTLKREMPILMYHRFIAHESEKGVHGTWMHEHRFENHLRLIRALGYETITLRDLDEKGFIHRFEPNKKYLIITADDGYRDNLTRMLPLLEKYDMKAVVFIVSNETHNRWDTDHPTNPDVRADLLSPSEIKALDDSGRIEIGGHTSSHAKLDELNPLEQRREITENKNRLESILRHSIISFAYPYGIINENAKSEVQVAGYRFAVATDSGPRQMHLDPFQIRRIAVFPRTSTFGLWRKIRGNYVWRR